MKKIFALSTPDLLLEGSSDGGVNGTPDEVPSPHSAWATTPSTSMRAAHGPVLG